MLPTTTMIVETGKWFNLHTYHDGDDKYWCHCHDGEERDGGATYIYITTIMVERGRMTKPLDL